jgi:hypothetical protein
MTGRYSPLDLVAAIRTHRDHDWDPSNRSSHAVVSTVNPPAHLRRQYVLEFSIATTRALVVMRA